MREKSRRNMHWREIREKIQILDFFKKIQMTASERPL